MECYSSIDGLLSIDPSFISHDLSLGTHEISLRVMDSEGLWGNYTYTTHEVFVIPMADAGEDIEVLPYLPIQFSGVAFTDEDGDYWRPVEDTPDFFDDDRFLKH